jgi:hypothetical protein
MDLAGSPRTADAVSSNSGRAHQGPTIDGAAAASKVHEHCALIQASRLRGIDWNPSWSVVPSGSLVAKAQSPIEDPVECGFPLYMLAPKQSPPC